jgi:N-acetylglutamate synthase-like GNAT family acetyltransferase
MDLKILPFQDEFAKAFYELNIEWLETYFYVEDYDKEVLSNPKKYIINPGGYIFSVIEHDTVIGTVALMPYSERVFELTKMAVAPKHRGNKIGQQLMQYCIDFAIKNKFDALVLYSNILLENAIYIYRKYGFIEIPVEENSPYKRCNIKMELAIKYP